MRRFSEPKREQLVRRSIDSKQDSSESSRNQWVANPVMVPKKDTTALRMCIDYTGLNKHCPKDHFPLPRIDQIVDSTAGCDRLSFLDAYSGYNQIKLKKEDQELTAFITPHGIFCYNVMTFGLKNAGATYQRCMQACLGEQIGRNIEVYIDDIVVKTKHTATLVDDLRETFDNLDSIVTDNGTNFDSKEFREFCDDRGIKLKFASVAHPQTNGQVERINGLIGDGLKKRLTAQRELGRGITISTLESAYHAQQVDSIHPILSVHGQAVLPADVRFEAPRVTTYRTLFNIALQDAADLLDEARDIALARTTVYQQALRNYHSRRIRNRCFSVGDMPQTMIRVRNVSHCLNLFVDLLVLFSRI
ncbi:hypothetical protein QYE76_051743 [Lolium multiflorum]|uniref:Integrase catalytic domain-containing protein n=1 Tax=Lolium multiflorum TaxID=4521 RepID=A0AAD8STM0_LOLMU|nr:hypothetical protein QYE76_051743 [Lolium multiflorum]